MLAASQTVLELEFVSTCTLCFSVNLVLNINVVLFPSNVSETTVYKCRLSETVTSYDVLHIGHIINSNNVYDMKLLIFS